MRNNFVARKKIFRADFVLQKCHPKNFSFFGQFPRSARGLPTETRCFLHIRKIPENFASGVAIYRMEKTRSTQKSRKMGNGKWPQARNGPQKSKKRTPERDFGRVFFPFRRLFFGNVGPSAIFHFLSNFVSALFSFHRNFLVLKGLLVSLSLSLSQLGGLQQLFLNYSLS